MEKQEMLKVIQNSITSFTSLKAEKINFDSDMSGDLALDSADRVELVLDLEEKFKISIPQDDYSWCKTIDDLITLISKIQNSQEVKQ
jgi:acyl carrier protein